MTLTLEEYGAIDNEFVEAVNRAEDVLHSTKAFDPEFSENFASVVFAIKVYHTIWRKHASLFQKMKQTKEKS